MRVYAGPKHRQNWGVENRILFKIKKKTQLICPKGVENKQCKTRGLKQISETEIKQTTELDLTEIRTTETKQVRKQKKQ